MVGKRLAYPWLAQMSGTRGSGLLLVVVFLLGIFFGISAARADELEGAKFISLYAKVVRHPGETNEHAVKRVLRVIGEADRYALAKVVRVEVDHVEVLDAAPVGTMFTILRDLVDNSQALFGTGNDRRAVFLFTNGAVAGQEGLALLGSACTNFAAGVVASKGYSADQIVSAGRAFAHELLHILGASHYDLFESHADGSTKPTLMHTFALGSFDIAQHSLDQVKNYITSIPPESYCFRNGARPSSPPAAALSVPIEMYESEVRSTTIGVPGSAPDYRTCSLDVDWGNVPPAFVQLVDAVEGNVAFQFSLDTVVERLGVKTFTWKNILHCASETVEQTQVVRVHDFDFSPLIIAPQTVFAATAGRSVRVNFWVANFPFIPGTPTVRCTGLPRGARVTLRNMVASFSYAPRATSTVSCTAGNAFGTSTANFTFLVSKPARRPR